MRMTLLTVVLGYLVTLRQVSIEVVLAVECRTLLHACVQSDGGPHSKLDTFGVQTLRLTEVNGYILIERKTRRYR